MVQSVPHSPRLLFATRPAFESPCLYKNTSAGILEGSTSRGNGGGDRAKHPTSPPNRCFQLAPRMSPLPRHSPIMRMRFTPHQMSGPFVQAAQERMSTPRMCSLCPHVSPCRTYPPFRMSKASAPPFRNRPAQKRESSAERAVRAMLFIARAVPLSSVPEIALPQNTHVPVRGRALSANATCRRTRSHSFPCATSSY